ncbi:MAG: alpha/beta hydrolase [Bacteroidota bacterium]
MCNERRLFRVITSAFAALAALSAPLLSQTGIDSAFSSSELTLNTTTGDILGTLTVPGGTGPFPLVLIIAGSGPTDRDCNSPIGMQTNAYKMLAEGFAGNGIATLRFDKRGIAKSGPAMTRERDLRFQTYVDDVVDWTLFMESDKRFSSITLLGHSEGSLIGILAAPQTHAAKFISVAGVGSTADKILQLQLKGKLPPALAEESNKILDSLRAGKTVSDVSQGLMSLYRPSVQPYMISWMKFDPAQEIAKLKIPVQIIQGTTDLQVTVDDAKLLSAAKLDAKVFIVENMNHVLKECDSDVQKNVATYRNPDLPLKSGLVEKMVDFVKGGDAR